ncbi:hypothetical protein GCM10027570_17870 [Streptomonospora sediminis]
MGDTILSLGLHPSAIDFSRHPHVTEELLQAKIAEGEEALSEAGFDVVTCQIRTDPDEAEKAIRECVAAHRFQVVMIGAGLRMAEEHTLLFEQVVNLLNELVPGIVYCFNTAPENTVDALRRWARPAR